MYVRMCIGIPICYNMMYNLIALSKVCFRQLTQSATFSTEIRF